MFFDPPTLAISHCHPSTYLPLFFRHQLRTTPSLFFLPPVHSFNNENGGGKEKKRGDVSLAPLPPHCHRHLLRYGIRQVCQKNQRNPDTIKRPLFPLNFFIVSFSVNPGEEILDVVDVWLFAHPIPIYPLFWHTEKDHKQQLPCHIRRYKEKILF